MIEYTQEELNDLLKQFDNVISTLEKTRMGRFDSLEHDSGFFILFELNPYGYGEYTLYKANMQYLRDEYPSIFGELFDDQEIYLSINLGEVKATIAKFDNDKFDSFARMLDDFDELADYPVWNDELMYQIESEMFNEYWTDYGRTEAIESVNKTLNDACSRMGIDREFELDTDSFRDDSELPFNETLDNALQDYCQEFFADLYVIEGSGVYMEFPTSEKCFKTWDVTRQLLSRIVDLIANETDKEAVLGILSQQTIPMK